MNYKKQEIPGTLEHACKSLKERGIECDMDHAALAAWDECNPYVCSINDDDLYEFVKYCKLGSIYSEWYESTKDGVAVNKALWCEYRAQEILKKLADKAGRLLISPDTRSVLDQGMEELHLRW